MLPTPSTERTQQKFETDWTPSSTGYHSSQENVSILTPQIPTDQALVKINEAWTSYKHVQEKGEAVR